MNDLLERYLGAVCSYFFGFKKKKVYKDLKEHILASVNHYDDLEDLLISYGHPRSVALSYGYRSFITHIYNHNIVSFIEKVFFTISGIYLFFSTLYYLDQLHCLPISLQRFYLPIITWSLSYPFIIMGSIAFISFAILIILDIKFPIKQEHDVSWSLQKLYDLPHQSHYPNHMAETIFIFIFALFFIAYTIFFSNDIILQIQHESYQMIHLMTYFFQPFIVIIFLDYVIDMTKKIYSKKYIKYSSSINLFTIISLTVFVFNSHFLADYLLPININFKYSLVDFFVIGALMMIYMISLYKLIRNLKFYRFLLKK